MSSDKPNSNKPAQDASADADLEKVQKRLDALGLTAMQQHQEGEGDGEEGPAIPRSVVHRLMGLRRLQADKEEIDKEYHAERLALELKYAEKLKGFYDSRADIIQGKVDVQLKVEAEGGELADIPSHDDGVEGIPDFWLTVLRNAATQILISDEDHEALKHLVDIRVEYPEDMEGFSLVFEFSENEFFTNKTLVKKYDIPDMLEDTTPTLRDITGTEIDWKPGKNLTVQVVQKKQRAKQGRNKGATRTVTQEVKKHSFFNFFSEPVDDEDEEEDDEEEALQLGVEDDYEFAYLIRSSLVPHAVSYYIGELGEDDEDEDEEDDEEGDEDEEGDDDEDDEDDDDEPDASSKPVRGGKGGKKGGRGAGANNAAPSPFAPAPNAGEQPECKQS